MCEGPIYMYMAWGKHSHHWNGLGRGRMIGILKRLANGSVRRRKLYGGGALGVTAPERAVDDGRVFIGHGRPVSGKSKKIPHRYTGLRVRIIPTVTCGRLSIKNACYKC